MNYSPLLQMAYQSYQRGSFSQALNVCEGLLQENPEDAEAWHLSGIIYYQQNLIDDAIEALQEAIKIAPTTAFHNNLGTFLEAAGRQDEALQHFNQAIALQPDFAKAHNNIGNVYQRQGEILKAKSSYQEALRLDSNLPVTHSNLGHIFKDLGELEEAIYHYNQALQIAPDWPEALHGLGSVYHTQGLYSRAENYYLQAISLKPLPETHNAYASLLQIRGHIEQALEHYKATIKLAPDFSPAYNNLGSLYQEQGKINLAMQYFQKALELEPDSLSPQLKLATLLPVISASLQEMHQLRERMDFNLKQLMTQNLSLQDPILETCPTYFYLAYQGLNDKPLNQSLATLYEQLCPSLLYSAPHCQTKSESKKIKIGFISKYFFDHAVSDSFRGLIAHFPSEDFEVITFAFAQYQDQISQWISENSKTHIQLAVQLAQAREQIADQALDILIYLDLGMDPFTYFLAFSRLAPIQCVMGGHPVTSGIKNIDYFISCRGQETAESSTHYSEELLLLENPPTYIYRPDKPTELKSRQELGMPEGHIYCCPQALFKFHPDFDGTLKNILEADPQGVLILFEDDVQTHWAELLNQRFKNTLANVYSRVYFLPHLPYQDFLNVLALSDVVLDTFPFGGGTTHYMTFAMETPLVTCPGDFHRGRVGHAFYQLMGLDEWVTNSRTEYVELALSLANDKERRDTLCQAIASNNHHLFENPAGVKELASRLKEIVTIRFSQESNSE